MHSPIRATEHRRGRKPPCGCVIRYISPVGATQQPCHHKIFQISCSFICKIWSDLFDFCPMGTPVFYRGSEISAADRGSSSRWGEQVRDECFTKVLFPCIKGTLYCSQRYSFLVAKVTYRGSYSFKSMF